MCEYPDELDTDICQILDTLFEIGKEFMRLNAINRKHQEQTKKIIIEPIKEVEE